MGLQKASCCTFSVIIPTYNRINTLKLVLKQLERQTFPKERFEVIVVDDGSTDGTLEFLRSYRGPLKLKVLETGLPEGVYGYLVALNKGIEAASGEYLVFLDSDMVPKEDALEKLYEAHKRWEARGERVAIRAWWVRRKNPLKMWLRGESFSRYSLERMLKRNRKLKKLYARRDNLRPRDAVSAFLSVRKEYALSVGGFLNETLYGLDGEFQERLRKRLGVRLVFEPKVYGIHGPVPGDVRADLYRQPRVLFIQGVPRFGGALRSLFLFMSQTKRMKCFLVTSAPGRLTDLCEREGIPFFTVSMPMWRKLKSWRRIPLSLYRLFRVAKKIRPSVVYANTLWDVPYAVFLGKVLGIPVVGHIRNTFSEDKVGKYLLFLADLLICVSHAVARPLFRKGLDVKVVYNGVFPAKGRFKKEKIFSVVGRVDSVKGQDIAIKAFSIFFRRVKGFRLVIAGEVSYLERDLLDRLKSLSESLGVRDSVVFTGHVEDVYEIFSRSFVSLVPSKPESKEGFGRIIPESMVNTTPVVASRIGGIPETMRDGKTGFLVDLNEESFAESLFKYFARPALEKKHGVTGALLSRRKFMIEQTCGRIESLIKELL